MTVTENVQKLMAMGAPQEAILAVVAAYEQGIQDGKGSGTVRVDEAAERRRAWDRQRKRKSGGNPVEIPPADEALQNVPTPLKTLSVTPKEKPPKGGQKKGARLPDGWRPSEALTAYAAERGVTGSWFDREVERFRNHWHGKSGRDAVKLDWDATFRNWILSAADRGPPKNTSLAGPSPVNGAPTHGQRIGNQIWFQDHTPDFEDAVRRKGKDPPRDKHGGWLFDIPQSLAAE